MWARIAPIHNAWWGSKRPWSASRSAGIFLRICRRARLASTSGSRSPATNALSMSRPPDTFTAEQILALARAARHGRHVNGGRRWASAERDVEQEGANAQDAALYTVAGFTGLRQGELRALRWKHVRFADRTIVVVAGMSAGEDSSTKSGKWRAVPLPREAFVALDELSRREWFTSPEDYVFCGPAGGPLDDSALRRRFNTAATRRACRRCRSTISATRSRRLRFVASIRRPSSRSWAIRRSLRPSAICMRDRSRSSPNGWIRSSD